MKHLLFETLKVADLNAWDISISFLFTALLIALVVKYDRESKESKLPASN
jgi:hypothetical protein